MVLLVQDQADMVFSPSYKLKFREGEQQSQGQEVAS